MNPPVGTAWGDVLRQRHAARGAKPKPAPDRYFTRLERIGGVYRWRLLDRFGCMAKDGQGKAKTERAARAAATARRREIYREATEGKR